MIKSKEYLIRKSAYSIDSLHHKRPQVQQTACVAIKKGMTMNFIWFSLAKQIVIYWDFLRIAYDYDLPWCSCYRHAQTYTTGEQNWETWIVWEEASLKQGG